MKERAFPQPQKDNNDHVDEGPLSQTSFYYEMLNRSMEMNNITMTYSIYIMNM